MLIDQLDAWAVPQTLRAHRQTLRRLGEAYKQLNAPFGRFGMDALAISTRAVKSGSANDDLEYVALQNQLAAFTARRNALAAQMRAALAAASFDGRPLGETVALAMIGAANRLLDEVHAAVQP